MAVGAIPPEVERFLLANVDTVPHLEALLLIHQAPAEIWTVAELAARIYVDDKLAASILEDLTRRALIARLQQTPLSYQSLERSLAQSQLLEQVVHAYRTQLVSVTRLIHSNASSSVRDFARAFRLKDPD